MLFTWDTTDLCIVFRSWHVSGTFSLIVALIGIVLLTAGYEAVREASRRYEAYANKALEGRRGGDDLRGESTCFSYGCALVWRMGMTERLSLLRIPHVGTIAEFSARKTASRPMNRAHCFTQGEMREAMLSSRRSLSRLRCMECRSSIPSSLCKSRPGWCLVNVKGELMLVGCCS